MLTCIEDLIDAPTLTRLRGWLSGATFEDGRTTAGGNARRVKHNEQVGEDPRLGAMQTLIEDQLWDHDLLNTVALPAEIHPPLFSRYTPGMHYGAHMDNARIGDLRVDLSLTLFLSDPADYDGGELVIDFATGTRAIKLSAGSGVLYPATELHHVAEVTRGQRLAAVTWVQSLVRDAAERQILIDLRRVHRQLSRQLGKTPEIDLLGRACTNLFRRWIED